MTKLSLVIAVLGFHTLVVQETVVTAVLLILMALNISLFLVQALVVLLAAVPLVFHSSNPNLAMLAFANQVASSAHAAGWLTSTASAKSITLSFGAAIKVMSANPMLIAKAQLVKNLLRPLLITTAPLSKAATRSSKVLVTSMLSMAAVTKFTTQQAGVGAIK